MKKNIFYLVAISAMLITSCRKIEMDGEKEIIIINGGGGGTTGQTITVSGRINADTTFRKANTYILKGLVYIVGNHTLTIEPGTVIKGSFSGSDVAALIITRGSKIVAPGTATDPIIFTSASPNPQSGDWGGIVLCGKASINASYNGTNGLYQVEGGIDNANGDGLAGSGDNGTTPLDTDSSGVLQYLRIEYAGYAYQPDKEINSLTMAAVGNKTVIDHIEVAYAKDDAYEWFGGTVNCKYLIAWKTQDDDFDTDNGYSGKVQFGLVMRDSLIADISTSEAFESDNNASGTTATPKTKAIFSNITAIGPRATLTNIGSSLFRCGAQIRRNSAISIFNSIFMGWPQGILIDGSTGTHTALNIEDSSLRLNNVTLAGNGSSTGSVPLAFSGTGGTSINSLTALTNWFTTPYYGNDLLATAADAKLIQPFNYTAWDPTPFAVNSSGGGGNVKINSGGGFTDPKFTGDTFFNKTITFRGGVAPAGDLANWWKGWTKFNYN